ncbi:MAG: flagellar basal body P-ring formation chaperone FlgA [Bacillota bacterium]
MRLKNLLIILLVFLMAFSINSPSVLAASKITIAEKEEVNSEWIKLGDIAKFSGFSSDLKKELASVKLEKAARPGYERNISRQLIKLVLKDKGYDIANFNFDVPNRVKVKTLSQKIDNEKLATFIKEHVRDNINYDYESLEIEITSTLADIKIPATDYSFKIAQKKSNYRGSYSLPVDIMVNDSAYKRIYINLKTNIYKKVFVANKTLFKDEKISKANFEYKKANITDIDNTLITDWDNSLVKDGLLSKTISKDEILTEEYLEKPIIIKWGDQIQAEIKIGGINVKTMVKAKERGKKGDFILVENLKTGKQFKAEVINRRLVRLVRN